MANDVFGIPQFKPTKSGGETFTMDNSNFGNQSRVIGDEFDEQDGYWTASGSFRANIEISTGFSDDDCTQNQQTMVDRGYMQDPNDWKNVEFTVEVKVFDSASDHATFGFRGGRHTGSGGPRGCTGSNYKVSVDLDGSGIKLEKESWHVSYHDCADTTISGWESTDGAFRLKILVYNSSDNKNVTVEVYLDKNATNDFQRIINFTDSGQVNSDAGECECNDDGQPLVWGSPTILIRADEGSYGIKNLTIREIDPFGSGGGDDGGGGSTPSSTGYSVSSVTASADDGHGPNNTRDGSFDTRWSAYADTTSGQWIKYDLGSAKPVDEVKIAWHLGSERTNDFQIHTSTDGTSWTQKVDDTSSGNTTGFESSTFTSVSARYVRITGFGNSSNDWVSITEVEIHGADSDPSSGGGDDGGGGTPAPETTADYNILETIFALDYNAIGLCNPAGTE